MSSGTCACGVVTEGVRETGWCDPYPRCLNCAANDYREHGYQLTPKGHSEARIDYPSSREGGAPYAPESTYRLTPKARQWRAHVARFCDPACADTRATRA